MSTVHEITVTVKVEIHDSDAYGNVQQLRDALVAVAELAECSFDNLLCGSSIEPVA